LLYPSLEASPFSRLRLNSTLILSPALGFWPLARTFLILPVSRGFYGSLSRVHLITQAKS
jgi:hypothetical protein